MLGVQVDDLIATGGTLKAGINLMSEFTARACSWSSDTACCRVLAGDVTWLAAAATHLVWMLFSWQQHAGDGDTLSAWPWRRALVPGTATCHDGAFHCLLPEMVQQPLTACICCAALRCALQRRLVLMWWRQHV
jgi:hypothetical protein